MDEFRYVDIFATKGIEYIAVIAFLLTFVVFWRILNRSGAEKEKTHVLENVKTTLVDWFYLANNFFYHQGHSWVKRENKNFVTIGMDDFAQKLVGRPDKIKLPAAGKFIMQGEAAWKLNFADKTITMLSPVNGKILEVNEKIFNRPELINEDPYDEGWLLKVKPSKFNVDCKNLLSGELAKAWLQNGVNILSNKMTGNYGVVFQDGGMIKSGFAKDLSPDNWHQLAREFFQSADLN